MSDEIKDFPSENDAWEWLYKEVDDPYIDNTRFAYADEPEKVAEFNEQRDRGCCGSFDADITINGREAIIGCNYGH